MATSKNVNRYPGTRKESLPSITVLNRQLERVVEYTINLDSSSYHREIISVFDIWFNNDFIRAAYYMNRGGIDETTYPNFTHYRFDMEVVITLLTSPFFAGYALITPHSSPIQMDNANNFTTYLYSMEKSIHTEVIDLSIADTYKFEFPWNSKFPWTEAFHQDTTISKPILIVDHQGFASMTMNYVPKLLLRIRAQNFETFGMISQSGIEEAIAMEALIATGTLMTGIDLDSKLEADDDEERDAVPTMVNTQSSVNYDADAIPMGHMMAPLPWTKKGDKIIDIMRLSTVYSHHNLAAAEWTTKVIPIWPELNKTDYMTQLSHFFGFWRGSIQYDFHFFTTPGCSGTVTVRYGMQRTNSDPNDNALRPYTQYLQFAGSTSHSVLVPALYPGWIPLDYYSYDGESDWFPELRVRVDNMIGMGNLTMYLVTSRRPGPDFQLLAHMSPHAQMKLRNTPLIHDTITGVKVRTRHAMDGEHTVLDLLQRYACLIPTSYGSLSDDQQKNIMTWIFSTVPVVNAGSSDNSVALSKFTSFNFLVNMYKYVSGDLDFRIDGATSTGDAQDNKTHAWTIRNKRNVDHWEQGANGAQTQGANTSIHDSDRTNIMTFRYPLISRGGKIFTPIFNSQDPALVQADNLLYPHVMLEYTQAPCVSARAGPRFRLSELMPPYNTGESQDHTENPTSFAWYLPAWKGAN
jgi:hypothetical protein